MAPTHTQPPMKLLALAGSLRTHSINAAFCRAAAQLAPAGLTVAGYPGLGRLPLFNPDLETEPPAAVIELRVAVGAADALLIASPEYAHGVSGVMKNALDWLVSFEGFVGKPVAVVNTSPRAHHAHDALLETLRTMSARPIPEACSALQLLGACRTEAQMLESAKVSACIRAVLEGIASFGAEGASGAPRFTV